MTYAVKICALLAGVHSRVAERIFSPRQQGALFIPTMSRMMHWVKWRINETSDPKLKLVARYAKQPLTAVIAVWAFLLEQAMLSTPKGSIDHLDHEEIAIALDLEATQVAEIMHAMHERLLDDGFLINWHHRDPSSSARVRKHRALKEHETSETDVTFQESDETPETFVTQVTIDKKRKEKKRKEVVSGNTDPDYTADFELLWSAYPKRSGTNNKHAAWEQVKKRLKGGVDYQTLHDGTVRYAAWAAATGKVGTEYVMQACTFWGPRKHYAEPYEIPGTASETGGHEIYGGMISW